MSKPTDVDALLLVSFGGPEGPDDVLPFLRNVTRGRNVPADRLAEVAEHYHRFGGRSPINDANRALLAALRAELGGMPVYWGNRNWTPYLAETLDRMRADGVRRAACFVTSAFASYSGCRQYREDLAAALGQVGPGAPELIKLRLFFDHPGFVEPMVDNTVAALASLPERVRDRARLVFTAHSLPLSQAETSGPTGGAYVRQLLATAGAVAERVAARGNAGWDAGWDGGAGWDLAYCSRSGPPTVPWLDPDINDRLAELADDGVEAVVIVPIGFVSDHMEVVYDLDVEAVATARARGVAVARAATVGTDPRFVAMVAELVEERRHPERERRALTAEGPSHDVCPLRCCEPRVRRPAAAGVPADLGATRPDGADVAGRGLGGRVGG